MGRRGKSSIMPRPNRNKIGTTGKVPRSPAKKGTSDVEQVAEDNFAEVVEQGALQLQERLAKKSNEASPKLRRDNEQLNSRRVAPSKLSSSSPNKNSPAPRVRTKSAFRKNNEESSADESILRKRPVIESNVLEELREKFQQLNMLRTTAAEALLDEYKKSAEERIQVAERVISALTQENESLRRTIPKNEINGRLSDVSSLSLAGGAFRSTIDLYTNLSGLQVITDSEAEQLYHCSLKGRHGEFTFDLALDEDGAQYCYTPTFSPKSTISSRLPAYLQEEIVFDADQLQLFFWRALNFLMSTPK